MRGFIQDKRDKKGKNVNRVNLEVLTKAIEKIQKVMERILVEDLFCIYKEKNKIQLRIEELSKILKKLEQNLYLK